MPSGTGPIGATVRGVRIPVPATLTGGPLGEWQHRNRAATLPHAVQMLESEGALNNLRRVIGESDASRVGMRFSDSDVYKTLEAVAWELARAPDAALQSFFDDTVALLARVQDTDGYLNSFFQDPAERGRWTWFEHGHELYCLGHLVQAAVAAKRAMNDDRLLTIAERALSDVHARFGADSPVVCGHPVIEMALIELSRLTGDRKHHDFALAMLERRGRGFLNDPTVGRAYFQDEATVVDARTMRGHAVRALYLASGVTDAVLDGAADYREVVDDLWDDLIESKLYVTGGAGARHEGEAFGEAFELPNDRAYAETCAGVALVQWAWRMHLATGRADVLDVLDTALWNAIAVGVGEAGTSFFYDNPLHVREGATHERTPWFSCACCPPNVARLIASIGHMLVTTDGVRAYIAGFAPMQFAHAGVSVTIDTDYPRDGLLTIRRSHVVPVSIRVPAWSSPIVMVDGVTVEAVVTEGWLAVPDTASDVHIDLDMHVRFERAHPRVDASRGQVAIVRGPVVYCLDQADNAAVLDDVTIESIGESEHQSWLGPLLAGAGAELGQPAELVARPYATWGNAAAGSLRVWIPAGEVLCASSS